MTVYIHVYMSIYVEREMCFYIYIYMYRRIHLWVPLTAVTCQLQTRQPCASLSHLVHLAINTSLQLLRKIKFFVELEEASLEKLQWHRIIGHLLLQALCMACM